LSLSTDHFSFDPVSVLGEVLVRDAPTFVRLAGAPEMPESKETVPEMCHSAGIAVSRHRAYEFVTKRGIEGRQDMNSFALGKLAKIHIQGLVDDADEGRKTWGATSQRRTPSSKHYFRWHKRRAMASPKALTT
jgi:hypothetical protein